MKIQFLGAARTVTGSSHFIEVNGKQILLDCGLFQGPRSEAAVRNLTLPECITCLDAVILSHGHLDHCGRLPVLFKNNYRGPIYTTPGSFAVAQTVLMDSAEIQMEDADYINRRVKKIGEPEVKPMYTTGDVTGMRPQFKTASLGRRVDLGNNVGFTFFEAGHILGSAYVWLDWKDDGGKVKHLLFTADIGRYDTPILKDPAPPPGPADLLITESTYGGKKHGDMSHIEPTLLELIKHVQAEKSRLIIPSFAVGRTQTMLWYIAKFIVEGKIEPIRVYIDSPMGVELTHTYLSDMSSYDEETTRLIRERDLFGVKNVTLASTGEQSRQINADRGPCVIIASSPTCEFGRVLHHLKASIERPQDVVLFVGWTPPRTLGRRLQDGEQRVKIYDRFYNVRCQIKRLDGMSAHADGDELVKFLTPAVTESTRSFIVHGEPDQSEIFAQRLITDMGVRSATVPAAYTTVFG